MQVHECNTSSYQMKRYHNPSPKKSAFIGDHKKGLQPLETGTQLFSIKNRPSSTNGSGSEI